MQQRPSYVVPVVIGVIVIIVAVMVGTAYNSLVTLGQAVDAQWGQVQNVYQRRADLIPNLVATVKGAANFESSTYEAVAKARASVGQISPAGRAKCYQQSARLRANMPPRKISSGRRSRGYWQSSRTIRSSKRPRTSQRSKRSSKAPKIASRSSEGNTMRSPSAFNTRRDTIPTVFFAGLFGSKFNEKPYFKSQPGAEQAPVVNFSP